MTTAAITAIGGDIAQGVATIARETFEDWRLVGTDLHSRHAGAHFVDEQFLAPSAKDPGYVDWLSCVIAQESVDICVPMSEPEIDRLNQFESRRLDNAKLIMPNVQAVDIGLDKLATIDFLRSIDCPVPWTVDADREESEIVFPCIFKQRRGSGSKSVFICASKEEAKFFRKRYTGGIFQELLLPEDNEITCAVYRTDAGQTVSLQLLRTLSGGFTGWAQVVDFESVRDQCSKVAVGLNLRGSINIQLRLTDKGPRIFEINPRFSSTALMRHRMGFCDIAWSLQEAADQEVRFNHPSVGTTAARVQGAVVLE